MIKVTAEFRQRTVAGLTSCTAGNLFGKDEMFDFTDYIRKILNSSVIDPTITIDYQLGYGYITRYRIFRDEWQNDGCVFTVLQWNGLGERTDSRHEKITAKMLHDMYKECANRNWEKEDNK